MLPNGALNNLLPSPRFRNPFRAKTGRRHRPRYHHRGGAPYYHDYDYRIHDYEDEYDYGYPHGPPRNHHHRPLRHGPPLFNRRMVEAYDTAKKAALKAQRRMSFSGENSVEDDENTISDFPSFDDQRHGLVKRQAPSTGRAPW